MRNEVQLVSHAVSHLFITLNYDIHQLDYIDHTAFLMAFNTPSTVTYFYYIVNRCGFKLNDLHYAFILNMYVKIKEKAFKMIGFLVEIMLFL